MFAFSISSINFSIEKWNGNERTRQGGLAEGCACVCLRPSQANRRTARHSPFKHRNARGRSRLWRIFPSDQWAFAEKVSSSIMKSQISIQQIIAEQFSDIYSHNYNRATKSIRELFKKLLKVIIFPKVRKTSHHTLIHQTIQIRLRLLYLHCNKS